MLESLLFGYIVVSLSGLALAAGIWAIRQPFQHRADHMRKTYELSFPKTMTEDQVLAFIRSLSGLPGPQFLRPVHAIVFETYADAKGKIKNYIHVPGHVNARVDTLLEEHIGGITITPVPESEDKVAFAPWEGVELRLQGLITKLRVDHPKDVAASIRASFRTLGAGERVVLQWVVFRDRPRAATGPDKAKVEDHTFHALARIGAVAEEPQRLIRDVYSGLSTVHAPGAHFIKRLVRDVPERIRKRSGTFAYPIFLNAQEFLALMGWPLDGSGGHKARRLEPDHMIDTEGIVVGASNYTHTRGRPLAVTPSSLLMHTWVLGPSGVGKSTVLHNMAAQIMRAGMGLVLIEPKGDLAHDVLRSVPHDRVEDVIWFDPTDTARPIGLNVLAGHDVDLITSHIVGMFHNIFHDSWGDRLARILRFSVKTAALNGLTLYDVRHLLMNPEFRAREVAKIRRDHIDLMLEWRWLDNLHDTAVDSVINKLDAFLGSTRLRNILGQKTGLDMADVVANRRILLVPLPSALIGQTNTSALGSLVREMLWDEVRRRPVGQRQPIILMMDEFQNYGSLDTSKSDPFAEARSYGLGLVIANQHTEQLSKLGVLSSVRANTGSKIVFGLEMEDAKKLKDNFEPLTADDLATLPKYGVAVSLMSNGGRAPVTTAVTAAPPSPTGAGSAARPASRSRHGRPVAEVEAELAERHQVSREERKRPSVGKVID